MPIEKQVVVHRFGIFTEARRDEFLEKVVSRRSLRSSNEKSSSDRYLQSIEEKLRQLNSAVTDIQMLSLEDEASTHLQKVKFLLSTIDSKSGLSDLKECWADLTLFISCKSRKLQDGALSILQRSLCDAPLSKSLMPTLLDIALSNIQEFLKEAGLYPWDSKYFLLSGVIFLICSRLYYHYLVQDLKELETNKLEELYILHEPLNETITQYKNNPILQNLLEIISHMIIAMCPVQRSSQSNHSDSEFLSEKDEIVGVNSKGSTNICERPPIAQILWHSLKLWKSASRQIEVERDTIANLCLIDFSQIDNKHDQWLDYILAFYTLCECSKLKINYLRIFLQFRTKMSPKMKPVTFKTNTLKEKYNTTWSLDLIITYLKCLADVCMFGINTPTQKLALLGDDQLYGMIDYLICIPEYEDSLKIRVCAYQLLSDVYSFYQSDPMKDGLKNITWSTMMKFKSCENNKLVLSIIGNYQTRSIDRQQSIGSMFSKVCTNLCIMAFSPNVPCVTSRNIAEDCKRRPNNFKNFDKTSKVKDRKNRNIQIPQFENKSREEECWLEVQRIAEGHFENELAEDEIEKEILRIKMLEEEEEVMP